MHAYLVKFESLGGVLVLHKILTLNLEAVEGVGVARGNNHLKVLGGNKLVWQLLKNLKCTLRHVARTCD